MPKFTFLVGTLLTISGAFWACNSDTDRVKDVENEVLALHDEVMPQMGTIMRLRKKLKKRIADLDSLNVTESTTKSLRTDEEKQQATLLNRNLSDADSLMMGWMTHYNGDTLARLSSDDALRYLTDQKDKIIDVKTKVTSSIEQAKQFLEKK